MTCQRDASPIAIDDDPNGSGAAKLAACFALFIIIVATNAHGGEADVLDAQIRCNDSRECTIHATVAHADSGWDHYADHWRILAPDGVEIDRRVLLHPHENEQPFTRSLSGVKVPTGVDQVSIQAHDNVHEYGGKALSIDIPD